MPVASHSASTVTSLQSAQRWIAASAALGLLVGLATVSAQAATCRVDGESQYGGDAPLLIDGDCYDPDYNEKSFVTDSVTSLSLTLPDGSSIPYTEVKGHFPPTRAATQLAKGVTSSPTTATHTVTWQFPDKAHWRNRFYQQSYPLPIDFLNVVDKRFAFTNGGYTVSVMPGNFVTGYRVSAAAAKLAKAYASKLYANTGRVYGYIYGQSGGSVQMMGANEGTVGVWDGIVPVVLAPDGLNTHSFQWDGLFALRVPEAKRKAIALAVAPGSGKDIYDGLTSDERAALDELLNAGFARKALETWTFSVGGALALSGALATFDPGYEDDFWSKPGYEGASPPDYLAAARVDGFAAIAAVKRDDKNAVVAVTFDAATVPKMGSIGDEGLQFHVYAADGRTRIVNGGNRALRGKLTGNTLTLEPGNDPVLLAALKAGGKVRINNRFVLAACFYPRHSILDNGNPAYNQYRDANGAPRYVQRPIQTAYIANMSSSGGRRETGRIKVKTVVIENLSDPGSYPYVGDFYAGQVAQALGPKSTADNFRIYYQDNAHHGAFPTTMPGPTEALLSTRVANVGGILNQALLDLAAWVERGVAPLPSTRYQRDRMNQIVIPATARARGGHQPVAVLSADGSDRAQVRVGEPVTLVARIDMPPRAGKLVEYDWYLGTGDSRLEPATALPRPKASARVSRKVAFAEPGEYSITFRVRGERNGRNGNDSTAMLENVARVQVVVR